ncbi:hypothetical protein U9M48_008007 [Paspalum notatum var. saurae]|uniref:Uncharacterized protein n=1 Tax=Paspalum notatum var. saurae TaxID=547442 RepID=A0AAQ3SNR3_PASNO
MAPAASLQLRLQLKQGPAPALPLPLPPLRQLQQAAALHLPCRRPSTGACPTTGTRFSVQLQTMETSQRTAAKT